MFFRDILAKGGRLAAFFCAWGVCAAQASAALPEHLLEQARDLRLSERSEWQALLHSQHGLPLIDDPSFLLSLPSFSPEKELEATLKALYGEDHAAYCRFPARYWWLRRELNAPELPLTNCPEIADFRARAPMDSISLVFASENQTQPASMLGHAFLKIAGQTQDGQTREHAISFYTDADTWNVPKLLVDSLVFGKNGYFSLSPYHEQRQRYVDHEQRSLWEYDLALDPWQRELVRLHLLELKQTRLTYFFQKYNCATVIHFILGLSGRPLPAKAWLSPKDVVQEASQAGLIQASRMIAPSRWLVRTLNQSLPASRQRENLHALQAGTMPGGLERSPSRDSFLQLEHAQALNQYLFLEGRLSRQTWQDNASQLDQLRARDYAELSLDLSKGFGPLDTPPTAQASLAWLHRDGRQQLQIKLLPASHLLEDDNRGYNHENELQILSPTISLPLNGGAPRLRQLVLYGMQTLLPRDPITGGVAGKLSIAYQSQLDGDLQERQVMQVGGAIGLARRLLPDADVYALAGGGLATGGEQGFAYGELEGGVMLREIWNMKTWLALSRHFNEADSHSAFSRVAWKQMHYLSRQQSLFASWQQETGGRRNRREWQLGFKQLF
ncbi:lipoprotein N-acyltransferase Lnb domain-containing protein [Chromobacterium paludis]|uniref:DUF4105 domain-containing protein n=1 Tax=Chromobacterium paludis TaxID=2605945 RepID=A0A5C1DJJ5_9NEIS|nr:DUF4105 domain-containing protein [Chromobacterium paludis]QEL56874.1 DUF4105 domain-containing protein [Chromobacterium paludis]